MALVVCVLMADGAAATFGIAVGEFPTAAAPRDQDPSADEATPALNRSAGRRIQQGLRNAGFDPGTTDGPFGPRTRAGIRDRQLAAFAAEATHPGDGDRLRRPRRRPVVHGDGDDVASLHRRPLVPGVTPDRAVHFTELRSRIDALRRAARLGPFSWTDPVLTAGATPVRRVHLLELRSALAAAYVAAGRAAPRWTDAVQAAGATPIRAAHLMELRAAAVTLE